ncbi:uncharacterized CRM domain-containing protein At3g25440, chloroplastic [Impatiens glandulifera]|uniref:uncharacterized CRM domain-containing protein At3g25440, chloroplastic n=1 Tax=Impatiens glandulifera TaxID=253017 RepID=UPI001FB16468|nr:uncharacterized CRM domain-containing protein At3g25440, chloroplastic [Impatiens glandulifera]
MLAGISKSASRKGLSACIYAAASNRLHHNVIADCLLHDFGTNSSATTHLLYPKTRYMSFLSHTMCTYKRSCKWNEPLEASSTANALFFKFSHGKHNPTLRFLHARNVSNASIQLKTENGNMRFCIEEPLNKSEPQKRGRKIFKRVKMSKKAKVNELRFYRLKAKRKMNSKNPEVRIRYKLDKAKRKEVWLIEKLKKYEIPKAKHETYDPEILTEEEKFYLKRIGEKKKNYVPVGRRGLFGGVVLNMHLHWKKHESVKVICKPCKPGQIHEYAEELARLSNGIVIDVRPDNSIIFYRGKNYVQPEVMSPPNTLSKDKALEKYRFEQSLDHTSQFIEKLEKELEEYHNHVAQYRKEKEKETEL